MAFREVALLSKIAIRSNGLFLGDGILTIAMLHDCTGAPALIQRYREHASARCLNIVASFHD
jgi:hypothetical protein